MTAALPARRLATTAQVAAYLRREPGYVRLLVSRGKLHIVGSTHGGGRGRPTHRFDWHEVLALVRDTPTLARREPGA